MLRKRMHITSEARIATPVLTSTSSKPILLKCICACATTGFAIPVAVCLRFSFSAFWIAATGTGTLGFLAFWAISRRITSVTQSFKSCTRMLTNRGSRAHESRAGGNKSYLSHQHCCAAHGPATSVQVLRWCAAASDMHEHLDARHMHMSACSHCCLLQGCPL